MKKSKYICLCYRILIVFIISFSCWSDEETHEKRKVHIIYMGSLPEGDYSARNHHINILQDIGYTNIEAEKRWMRSCTRSFNCFVANITSSEASKLEDMEGIVSVFESRQLQLQTTRSWDYMGLSLEIPRYPIAESNIIVGHIDSGVIPNIESFSDHNLGDVPTKWKGVCYGGKNFPCNKKLIGARYYDGNSAIDRNDHGTHTASTVAGRVLTNANLFGIANGTARGGVPSARIATYKVCEYKCYASYIIAAFDDAIADGVDIITISIGFLVVPKISEDVIAISSFHAMEKGILTVQAAGNSGVHRLKTVVSTAPWLLTVAASTTDRKFVNKVILGNGHTLISSALNPYDTGIHNKRLVYGKAITRHCNESSARQCEDGCIDSHLVKKKILVCDVDDADFFSMDTVINSHAEGIILRESKFENDGLEVTSLPGASLNDHDFHYIESYLKSRKNSSARILKSETICGIHFPIVGSFSKKGPNINFPEILKPDITAPGINILAQTNLYKVKGKLVNKYSIKSGTSMSCPHVAGATAYVKSKHPDWSPSALKSSLMTTDAELGYGAGHIDPVKAAYPGLVYETFIDEYMNMFCSLGSEGGKLRKIFGAKHKCLKGKEMHVKDLNYPTMTAPVNTKSSFNIQFRRVVTNVGHANSTYHVQISTGDSSIYVSVKPTVLSFVRLKERKKFIVTVSGEWVTQDHVSCSLVWSDGSHRVKSPILLYPSSIL